MERYRTPVLLILFLFVQIIQIAHAAEPVEPAESEAPPGDDAYTYYFYQGLDYGSDSLTNPLRLCVNGGFGIMQIDNRSNNPWKIKYARGARNVWDNCSDPFSTIRVQGWWDFLNREIIPVSINSGKAQYWPNYTQHLIGGGMSYRLMSEWYRHHGISHAETWSVVTMFWYHFLNEVVENDDRDGPTTDPIADLLVFDPVSIWLFSSEKVCRFFGETLHMADWSYQPVYIPQHQTLQNNGQNYAIKYALNKSGSTSLFYHWGTHAEAGLSFTRPSGDCFSFGLGLVAKELVEIDKLTQTVSVAASAGLFYDRNNSLLASLLYSKKKDYRTRLNVYPGLVKIGRFSPGFFVALNRDRQVMTGITIRSLGLFPVGLGGMF